MKGSSQLYACLLATLLISTSLSFTVKPLPSFQNDKWIRQRRQHSLRFNSVFCQQGNSPTQGQTRHSYLIERQSTLFDLDFDVAATSTKEAASSLWTCSVETFDGSSIVDPIVVSNVFWLGLKSKLLSVIIGQFLAAIAFAILTSFVSASASKVFEELVSKQLKFLDDSYKQNTNQQKKTTPPSVTSSSVNNINTINPDFGKLLFCIIIDTLGTSSEFIPFVGELTDVAYAPFAALALRSLFQGSNLVFALEFIEEILPFTDILPLATICWVVETYYSSSDLARLLKIGDFGPAVENLDNSVKNEDIYSRIERGNKIGAIRDDNVIDIPFSKSDDGKL